MRLYLIKRKLDKKFFVSINKYCAATGCHDPEYWSDKPQQFLKTPEGVAGNLRKLCSKAYHDTEAPPGVGSMVAENWSEIAWHKFDSDKLKQYEVVIMDVDVISMTATPATEFVQIEAIKSQPLSSKERKAA